MIDPVSTLPSIAQTSLQGMQRAQAQLNTAATNIARLPEVTQPGQGGDVVDLSTDMVALLSSRDNFMANVEAAKTGDQMQRDLLNMIA